jgi:gas vesicle protein
MTNKNHNSNAGKLVAGLTAIAAATAGAYFLYGKNGTKNRKAVKGWMLKIKGDVVDKMENLKEVSETTYNTVIDQVADKYSKMKTVAKDDLDKVVTELRGHWKSIKKEIEPKAKKASKKTTNK